MGITALKRKVKRRIFKGKQKNIDIKRLNAKPVVRKVTVEDIKKEFAAKAAETAQA